MSLAARIVPLTQLDLGEREAMFALMARHYDNLHLEVFLADLAEKDWIILLDDPADGSLQGFSTQVLLDVQLDGRRVGVLFSGDTIVDSEHWGSTALAIAWGKLAFAVMEECGHGELYWFLASKGFRTYRYLPVYFHEFYPRFDRPTPADMQAVIDAVGAGRYPDRYDPASGIILAVDSSDRLRAGLAGVPEDRARDPHVEYFLRRNPGYARGDELCCLAPLRPDNFSPAARKLIDSERFARQGVP
jgi:hypothetical protein